MNKAAINHQLLYCRVAFVCLIDHFHIVVISFSLVHFLRLHTVGAFKTQCRPSFPPSRTCYLQVSPPLFRLIVHNIPTYTARPSIPTPLPINCSQYPYIHGPLLLGNETFPDIFLHLALSTIGGSLSGSRDNPGSECDHVVAIIFDHRDHDWRHGSVRLLTIRILTGWLGLVAVRIGRVAWIVVFTVVFVLDIVSWLRLDIDFLDNVRAMGLLACEEGHCASLCGGESGVGVVIGCGCCVQLAVGRASWGFFLVDKDWCWLDGEFDFNVELEGDCEEFVLLGVVLLDELGLVLLAEGALLLLAVGETVWGRDVFLAVAGLERESVDIGFGLVDLRARWHVLLDAVVRVAACAANTSVDLLPSGKPECDGREGTEVGGGSHFGGYKGTEVGGGSHFDGYTTTGIIRRRGRVA